jgi:transmembrane sensor
MKNKNEIYLSDWLANKITDEELKEIVSENDFTAYKKIRNSLNHFEIKEPNMEQNFQSTIQKIKAKQKNKAEKKPTNLWTYVSIAASFIILIGLYQLVYFSNTVASESGKIKAMILSDHSKVTLNTKSKISYPTLFKYNRTLQLEGEAFFEVQKGSKFIVKTSLGTIKVLGTKFNVNSSNDYFEVVCYSGSVWVEHQNTKIVLKANDGIRFYENKAENWTDSSISAPTWLQGESTFKNVPIKYVIENFEKQYNVSIKYSNTIDTIKFTGSFTHENIETALKSICYPLNLKFSNKNGTISIYK